MIFLGKANPLTIITTRVVGTIINFFTVIPTINEKGDVEYITSIISQVTIMNDMPVTPEQSFSESLTKKVRSLEEVMLSG